MKKTLTLLFLLSLCLSDAFGQWYERKYNVTDINFLTREQLEEANKDTKANVYVSLAFVGLGGVVILAEKLMPYKEEDDEDLTLIKQLLGEKGVHTLTIVAGAGIACAGVIACISYLGRLGTIRSALYRNFPASGSLSIAPAVILTGNRNTISPGLTLTFTF